MTPCSVQSPPLTHFIFAQPEIRVQVALTLRLSDPADDILLRRIRLLRDCVALAQLRYDFAIEAAVVLPGQMKLLCSCSEDSFDASAVAGLITSAFARHMGRASGSVWSDAHESVAIPGRILRLHAQPDRGDARAAGAGAAGGRLAL